MIAWLAACSPPDLEPAGRPATVEGVVLLAELASDVIRVEGILEGAPQRVDLDAAPDDRYGFRYRVLDADGEVLTERTTLGPALVESFLDYWSEVSGFDILHSVPTLGRFPIVLPLLDDAAVVELEVRDEQGTFVRRGLWDYERLAEPRVTVETPEIVARETLVDHGSPDHRLDVVLLPDGYRAEELDQFRADAERVKNAILRTEPFATYADRLNVVRLDVESAEAGAAYDCPTCGPVNNALGSIFPIELVNRFTGSGYEARAVFQLDQWKLAGVLSEVPWDAAIVIINSPQSGGMAVHFATVTTGVGDLGPTAVHELGHGFGLLGDEYVTDDCIRSGALGLPENIADSAREPPWSERIAEGTPLPTPYGAGHGIGAYQGAWNCGDLFRPAQECRMNDGGPFCEVCSELLVRRLLRFGDPAESVTVDRGELVITGALPDTSVLVWADGELLGEGTPDDPPALPRRAERLEVELTHRSAFVGRDPTGDLTERWVFGER